jgi:hypothetical protein
VVVVVVVVVVDGDGDGDGDEVRWVEHGNGNGKLGAAPGSAHFAVAVHDRVDDPGHIASR